jgi:hypothetical protein
LVTDKPIAGTRRSSDPFDDKKIAIIAWAAHAKTYALVAVGMMFAIAVAYASRDAYALGNAIGLGPLTGGAVRYRFYGAEETESGCPALVAIGAEVVKTGGGHHLGGD